MRVRRIEHLDTPVLARFAPSVLGGLRPRTLIVTTPNADFNAAHFPWLATERRWRHPDHRFEWTRAQFASWCVPVFHHGVSMHVYMCICEWVSVCVCVYECVYVCVSTKHCCA
jgi:hypothetical protein